MDEEVITSLGLRQGSAEGVRSKGIRTQAQWSQKHCLSFWGTQKEKQNKLETRAVDVVRIV